jgi:hypothetical protein
VPQHQALIANAATAMPAAPEVARAMPGPQQRQAALASITGTASHTATVSQRS